MTNTTPHPTRYTRQCPTISQVTTWHNDGLHASHSTPRCRTWGQPRRHYTPADLWAKSTVTDRPLAWICTACTADDPTPDEPESRLPAVCGVCDRFLPVTKFPTVRVYGEQFRDTRRCRDCRDAHAPMPPVDPWWGVDDTETPVAAWVSVVPAGVWGWDGTGMIAYNWRDDYPRMTRVA